MGKKKGRQKQEKHSYRSRVKNYGSTVNNEPLITPSMGAEYESTSNLFIKLADENLNPLQPAETCCANVPIYTKTLAPIFVVYAAMITMFYTVSTEYIPGSEKFGDDAADWIGNKTHASVEDIEILGDALGGFFTYASVTSNGFLAASCVYLAVQMLMSQITKYFYSDSLMPRQASWAELFLKGGGILFSGFVSALPYLVLTRTLREPLDYRIEATGSNVAMHIKAFAYSLDNDNFCNTKTVGRFFKVTWLEIRGKQLTSSTYKNQLYRSKLESDIINYFKFHLMRGLHNAEALSRNFILPETFNIPNKENWRKVAEKYYDNKRLTHKELETLLYLGAVTSTQDYIYTEPTIKTYLKEGAWEKGFFGFSFTSLMPYFKATQLAFIAIMANKILGDTSMVVSVFWFNYLVHLNSCGVGLSAMKQIESSCSKKKAKSEMMPVWQEAFPWLYKISIVGLWVGSAIPSFPSTVVLGHKVFDKETFYGLLVFFILGTAIFNGSGMFDVVKMILNDILRAVSWFSLSSKARAVARAEYFDILIKSLGFDKATDLLLKIDEFLQQQAQMNKTQENAAPENEKNESSTQTQVKESKQEVPAAEQAPKPQDLSQPVKGEQGVKKKDDFIKKATFFVGKEDLQKMKVDPNFIPQGYVKEISFHRSPYGVFQAQKVLDGINYLKKCCINFFNSENAASTENEPLLSPEETNKNVTLLLEATN